MPVVLADSLCLLLMNYMRRALNLTRTRKFIIIQFMVWRRKALPHILCVTNMLLHDIDNPEIIHGNTLETDYKEYRKMEKFDLVLMNPPYGGNEKDSVKSKLPYGTA